MDDRQDLEYDLGLAAGPNTDVGNWHDLTSTAHHQRNGFDSRRHNVQIGNNNIVLLIGGGTSNNRPPPPAYSTLPPTETERIDKGNLCDFVNYAPQEVRVNDTGVSFDRPKYIQFAIRSTRQKTFSSWKLDHCIQPCELAEAGFFYTERGDTVVCFYCGLALNEWEKGDKPWTEHARWSPNCTHILNMLGPNFVKETLACKGDTRELQTIDAKYKRMKEGSNHDLSTDSEPQEVKSVPKFYEDLMQKSAVQSVLDMSYDESKVRDAIRILLHRKSKHDWCMLSPACDCAHNEIAKNHSESDTFSAVELMHVVFDMDDGKLTLEDQHALKGEVEKAEPNHMAASTGVTSSREDTCNKDIITENRQLHDQLTCKICLENPVCIVFLPCGHLACCAECSPALKNCPICRANIKGSVKTFLT